METAIIRQKIWDIEREISELNKKKEVLLEEYAVEIKKDLCYESGWPGTYWLNKIKGHIPNPEATVYKCTGISSPNLDGIIRALNYSNQH